MNIVGPVFAKTKDGSGKDFEVLLFQINDFLPEEYMQYIDKDLIEEHLDPMRFCYEELKETIRSIKNEKTLF